LRRTSAKGGRKTKLENAKNNATRYSTAAHGRERGLSVYSREKKTKVESESGVKYSGDFCHDREDKAQSLLNKPAGSEMGKSPR